MANVFFKRGAQADFNNITSWQEGAFYLTTDTQRLYYSDGSKAVQVNPGITTVANVAGLPNANQIKADDYGQFYYCQAENILAIYQGSNKGWIQINASEDTFINQRIINTEKTNNSVSIEDVLYLTDTSKTGNYNTLESNLKFTGVNGLTVDIVPRYTKANKDAFRPDITYYTLSGSTYTKVTTPTATAINSYYVQNGYELSLTPPTYTLSSSVTDSDSVNEAKITLNGTTSTDNEVVLEAGANIALENHNGKIKITGSDGEHLQSVYGNANATTGFDVTVTMSSGDGETGTIDPVIKLGTNADAYHFNAGVATLPVYTKTEVDNKIRDFNAMEYKGTITLSGLSSKLSTTQTEHNGWVYMLSEDGNISILNGKIVPNGAASGGSVVRATAGDLIVVQGAENNGVVSSPEYVHIPSGNDHDTTYTFTKVTHGISITDDRGSTVGGISVVAGNGDIILSDTDNSGDADREITISHKTVVPQTATATGIEQEEGKTLVINVPNVEFDSTGHVSKITTQSYKVTDTHADIEHSVGVSNTDNVATVTSTVKVDGENYDAAFTLTSDNLAVYTRANNSVTMNLEWGSF